LFFEELIFIGRALLERQIAQANKLKVSINKNNIKDIKNTPTKILNKNPQKRKL